MEKKIDVSNFERNTKLILRYVWQMGIQGFLFNMRKDMPQDPKEGEVVMHITELSRLDENPFDRSLYCVRIPYHWKYGGQFQRDTLMILVKKVDVLEFLSKKSDYVDGYDQKFDWVEPKGPIRDRSIEMSEKEFFVLPNKDIPIRFGLLTEVDIEINWPFEYTARGDITVWKSKKQKLRTEGTQHPQAWILEKNGIYIGGFQLDNIAEKNFGKEKVAFIFSFTQSLELGKREDEVWRQAYIVVLKQQLLLNIFKKAHVLLASEIIVK